MQIEDHKKFRVTNNELFPTETQDAFKSRFKMKNLSKKNVYFSKDKPESWYDVIQRKPILEKKAAILPEIKLDYKYWMH